jgi:hypothetical protein
LFGLGIVKVSDVQVFFPAWDKSDKLIDEEFEEVELTNGSCVEFKCVGDFWYILSSDGLKNS